MDMPLLSPERTVLSFPEYACRLIEALRVAKAPFHVIEDLNPFINGYLVSRVYIAPETFDEQESKMKTMLYTMTINGAAQSPGVWIYEMQPFFGSYG